MQSITAADVAKIMQGEQIDAVGELKCEDMAIARVSESGEIEAVACPSSCHGVHPRYQEAAEKLAKAAVEEAQAPTDCERCKGVGWLEIGTQAAGEAVAFALTVGMYRGVVLDFGDLAPQARRDMLLSSIAGTR
jgi:hypothetical protein